MVNRLKPYLGITVGAVIFAIGLNYFTIANRLAEGGVTGVALLLHYLLRVPIGALLLGLNIPLFLLGWHFLGWRFVVRSLYGVLIVSVAAQFIGTNALPSPDRLLGALYAGAVSGLGLGIIFRSGGTSGGVDIIARILWHRRGIEIGRTMFAGDLIVMVANAMLLDYDTAMYSLVAMFIASRVIDAVQEGATLAKSFTIISNRPAEIAAAVTESLERGATILRGKGAYTGQDRNVLYVVIPRSEVTHLKNIVYAVDPGAFVVISDAREVVGEGFTERFG
ncbi:MAG: YitT family protein [Chloroflexota bacterium]